MSNQDKGEHSRPFEPNEDEKPLKKARYVWEVKGKYHLRDTYKNNNTVTKNNNTETELGDSSKKCVEEEENKVEDEGKSAHEDNSSNKCCIDSFLAKTEAILECDVDEEDTPMVTLDGNILNDIPVSLVSPVPKNQDYYLRKWQARQIARGFVDNTINTVLETWINPPFDAADLIENCANDGQVEDDAILMAIQSHGLQSNASSNALFPSSEARREIAFVRSPEIEESTMDNFANYQNELKEQGNGSESTSCDSSASNSIPEGVNLDMGDPMDFLNAAVSVAIQKKGLSYGY